jgi:hypothetical protein
LIAVAVRPAFRAAPMAAWTCGAGQDAPHGAAQRLCAGP